MGSKTPITTASQSFILCVVDFHISGFHHFSIVAQWHVASGLSSPLRFATFPFGRVRFRALYPLAIIRLPSTFRASVASGENQPAPRGGPAGVNSHLTAIGAPGGQGAWRHV